ncbi:MAG: molybdenum cofactor biosynthesis protein MoaE [Xanthomonadales bacterium]|nr:molybdenum cofactor biosynthesis protein MoaE [Gammaproteobacteria bacterium]MBT8072399.1 molybdenum cofactor biosynthesis protein MoaE [Gammaproteobacteria bacterium]NNK03240.1 molybdenum cofactor biosynthesis protein MoaE [Xanthomonadales bacterium]NNK99314.1 molybdenum cofactor biosynthesis protein MoaE [Xanthomonadales bacterium]
MKFSVSDTPIDVAAARQAVADRSCGALVVFEGWIRDHNEGQEVERLEYEVYRPVAVKEGERIIDEAVERFGVSNALCIHREGLLELGEVAVLVCVSSPHRGEAFDACRYIIDQAKTRLPIWKKEHYVSGVSEWVNCEHCAAAGHAHGETPHD